ncbi:GNAT family N-acetyltransferase [Pseudoduganella sp. RAF53_2]|uniref:GNAT family N-acetyltransferase n=1 Tax=unclassified Pseudoduganella TaxID=2637179 RepID=UPI003F97EA1C
MTAFTPFTLATPRLTLRFIAPTDAPALFAMYSDPEAMRYWSSGPWEDIAQAESYAAAGMAGYESGAMLRLGFDIDGTLAGVVNLYKFDEQNRRCDIGYMLGRSSWGKGYMREALAAALEYAFSELHLHRVEADIDPRNHASARLLQSLHFVKEGHLRERWMVNGEICDSDIYGLLRADWRRAENR